MKLICNYLCLFLPLLFLLLLFPLSLLLLLNDLLYMKNAAKSKVKLLAKPISCLHSFLDSRCLWIHFLPSKMCTFKGCHSNPSTVTSGIFKMLSARYPIWSVLSTLMTTSCVTTKSACLIKYSRKRLIFSPSCIVAQFKIS